MPRGWAPPDSSTPAGRPATEGAELGSEDGDAPPQQDAPAEVAGSDVDEAVESEGEAIDVDTLLEDIRSWM